MYKIKMILFDIDGVITDGKKYTDGKGIELKSITYKDLDALQLLKDMGYQLGCVTGEDTAFSRQFEQIQILDYVKLGCKQKEKAFEEIQEKYRITASEICYIGDGKYDIPVLKRVGLAICPADAIEEVKQVSDVVLKRNGGDGCIAEIYTLLCDSSKNRANIGYHERYNMNHIALKQKANHQIITATKIISKNRRENKMTGEHVFIIAEIGINHNGDMEIAKKLIDWAVLSDCDAVKFQKRTVDKVYTKEYLDSYRESPWGTTQRAQKEGLEFGKEDYDEIDRYCKEKGIQWFASAWDTDAQKFLRQYDLKYNKIASAMLTNDELLQEVASEKKYTFIATGMSTYDEIDHAVKIFKEYDCPFELMHCNSTYPMPKEDANLRLIPALRERYGCRVGYSGHEVGRIVSTSAVALGATSIERHVTLDNTMYGSDQAASLNVKDLLRLTEDIRVVETILGNGEKVLSEKELATRMKLRGC